MKNLMAKDGKKEHMLPEDAAINEGLVIMAEKGQDKLLLKLRGRLDTTTSPQLEKVLETGMDDIRLLVLDFAMVEYISSAGLRVLLAAHKSMKKQSGAMAVKGINEEVREVLNITGFLDILNVV